METQWVCTAIGQGLEISHSLNLGEDIFRFENHRSEILTRRCLNGEWRTTWAEDDSSLFEFPQPVPDASLVERIRGHRDSIRPSRIRVASPATHALLRPTASALGIQCDLKKHLPVLDEVLDSSMGFMVGRH